jgi:hypothetical protein
VQLDFAAIANMPTVNPLHKMAVVAAFNILIAEQHGLTSNDGVAMPWLERLQEPSNPASWSISRRLQMEAVQACVNAHPELEWETIYIDELSWAHNGFDLMVRNRETQCLKLIEVKGTSLPFRSAGGYLKRTIHKGRQLSWKWIWASAMELAEMPSTAAVFFPVVRSLLTGCFSRELRIVRFDKAQDYQSAMEMLVIDESRLSLISDMDEFSTLRPKMRWLHEIDASADFGFGYPECFGALGNGCS